MASDVFVLGTIQHFHAQFEHHSYWHVMKLMSAFGPDLVCVEMPPAVLSGGEFRRHSPEKWGVVLPWAHRRQVPVAGVDWDPDSARMETGVRAMRELMESDEGSAEYHALEATIDDLVDEAGGWGGLVGTYEDANGASTQDLFRRIHGLSTSVLSEGPLNGYWNTRNGIITSRVVDAATKHRAGRTMVIVGVERKHALDDLLSQRGMTALTLSDFLSEPVTLTEDEKAAFARGDDPIVYPSDLMFIHRRLHGGEPASFTLMLPTDRRELDLSGVEEKVEAWLALRPEDPDLVYYRGMLRYATGDLESAAECFRGAASAGPARLDTVPMVHLATLRLGQMLDLLGDREGACDCYRQVLGTEVDDEARPLLDIPFTIIGGP